MSAGRFWFDEGPQREALEQKISSGWFISARGGEIVGQVVRLIYAGYKVRLHRDINDNEEIIVHPEKDDVVDLENTQAYHEALAAWKERDAKITAERVQHAQKVAFAHAERMSRQASCRHEETRTECVVRAAGCDIYDTVCVHCEKRLRRSWSTAYENDPDDHIADWNWWLRYYKKEYGGVPREKDYQIVPEISPF